MHGRRVFDVHKFLFMIRPAVVLASGPPEAEHLKPKSRNLKNQRIRANIDNKLSVQRR
jgi:hypothetical protein